MADIGRRTTQARPPRTGSRRATMAPMTVSRSAGLLGLFAALGCAAAVGGVTGCATEDTGALACPVLAPGAPSALVF